MKRSSARLLAAAVGVTALAPAVISPMLSSAHSAAPRRTMTFQEPRPHVASDDLPPRSKKTLSLGDRLVISGVLESSQLHRMGTFGGQCTALGSGSYVTTPLMCAAVYKLADGQIEATGMMTLGRTQLAIVGGTGTYAGVHGAVTPGHAVKGVESADELTIER